MERVSTGERTAADQLMVSDRSPGRALTERILEIADEAGYRAALIDATVAAHGERVRLLDNWLGLLDN